MAQYRTGLWAESTALLERAQQLQVSGVAEIFLQLRLAALEVGRGDLDAAEQRLDHTKTLCEKTPDTQWVAPLTQYRAALAIELGQPESARQAVREGIGILGPAARVAARTARAHLRPWHPRRADLAALARARRREPDLGECQAIAAADRAELDAVAHETSHNEPAFAPLAQAYLTLGSAEVSRVEGRSDPTIWSEAAAGWQALAMPHAEAYARFRQAEAVLHRNDSRRAAQEVLRNAHDLARDLGAAALLRDVEELAKRSRLEIGADGTGRTSEGRGPGMALWANT